MTILRWPTDFRRPVPSQKFLCLLLAAAGLAHAEAPFDFDHTPGKLPKTLVPQSYVIDIVPNLQTLRLTGHEAVTLDFRQPASAITLNQAGLTLTRAALEDGRSAAIREDDDQQTATLRFAATIPAGIHTLTIDYHGPIPNSPAGIYYDDYKTPSGATKRMLVTQFEVSDARRMFPGWDEPAFKAKFTLSAVLPSGLAAISNMPVASRTPAGAGLTRFQFAPTPRMSSYLLALVAGELGAVRGTAGRTALAVWAPAGEEAQRVMLSASKPKCCPITIATSACPIRCRSLI